MIRRPSVSPICCRNSSESSGRLLPEKRWAPGVIFVWDGSGGGLSSHCCVGSPSSSSKLSSCSRWPASSCVSALSSSIGAAGRHPVFNEPVSRARICSRSCDPGRHPVTNEPVSRASICSRSCGYSQRAQVHAHGDGIRTVHSRVLMQIFALVEARHSYTGWPSIILPRSSVMP